MKRIPVQSSHIVAIGHDPKSNTMEVEFRNGSVYRYGSIDVYKHSQLIGADSIGKHFRENIKSVHTGEKIS